MSRVLQAYKHSFESAAEEPSTATILQTQYQKSSVSSTLQQSIIFKGRMRVWGEPSDAQFVRSNEITVPSVRAVVGEPQNKNILEVRPALQRLDVQEHESICAPRRNQVQDRRTELAVSVYKIHTRVLLSVALRMMPTQEQHDSRLLKGV